MKSACVGVLSIIELKNARWNTKLRLFFLYITWWFQEIVEGLVLPLIAGDMRSSSAYHVLPQPWDCSRATTDMKSNVYCLLAVTGHQREQTVFQWDSLAGGNGTILPGDMVLTLISVGCESGLAFLLTQAQNDFNLVHKWTTNTYPVKSDYIN